MWKTNVEAVLGGQSCSGNSGVAERALGWEETCRVTSLKVLKNQQVWDHQDRAGQRQRSAHVSWGSGRSLVSALRAVGTHDRR